MRRTPQLPEELVEEILVRLQVVDLLRCKTVCRVWFLLISDGRFVRRHLELSKANPSHHRILTRHTKSSMKSIDCSDLFVGEVVTDDLPPPCKTEVTFLGTCDGLVCCFNNRNKRILMWNPAIRMYKSLNTLEELNRGGVSFHWFGHASDDDAEYKLVIGSTFDMNLIHVINPFSADEEGWKSTLKIGKPYLQFGIGTLFNGRVHWASCYLSGDKIGAFVIFSFDLRSQTIIEIPGHEGTVMLEFATMCVINGRLSAIHRSLLENDIPDFEVWTMKEYGVKESWTKLTTILSDVYVRPCIDSHYPYLCVIAVTDKGDMVIKVENSELLVCNIAEGKSRRLMSNRRSREGRAMMYVVESLVFPSGVPIVGYLGK